VVETALHPSENAVFDERFSARCPRTPPYFVLLAANGQTSAKVKCILQQGHGRRYRPAKANAPGAGQKCGREGEHPETDHRRALVARYVGMAMGWYTEDQAAGWIASLVGAVVLLFIYGMIKGRSTGS
jgi:hypothetical protein